MTTAGYYICILSLCDVTVCVRDELVTNIDVKGAEKEKKPIREEKGEQRGSLALPHYTIEGSNTT